MNAETDMTQRSNRTIHHGGSRATKLSLTPVKDFFFPFQIRVAQEKSDFLPPHKMLQPHRTGLYSIDELQDVKRAASDSHHLTYKTLYGMSVRRATLHRDIGREATPQLNVIKSAFLVAYLKRRTIRTQKRLHGLKVVIRDPQALTHILDPV